MMRMVVTDENGKIYTVDRADLSRYIPETVVSTEVTFSPCHDGWAYIGSHSEWCPASGTALQPNTTLHRDDHLMYFSPDELTRLRDAVTAHLNKGADNELT